MSLLTQGHLGDLDQSGLVSDSQQLSEFQESKAFQSDNIDNNTTDLKRMNLAKCNWYELAGAVSAGLIFIALHYVPGKLKNTLYIAFIFIAFGSYIVYKIRYYGYKLIVYDWGLTLNNFNISFLWCTVVGLIGSIVMISYMLIFGTGLAFHYDLILMFIFYPFWGVIQQFLIQGMIAINLTKLNINYYLIICLTACSFTLVHWPDCLLMFATFCVGLTFTPIFLKYKCLYPLGIYHGWCGALFYCNTSRRHFCVGIQSSTYPFAKRAGVTQQLLHGSPCDYICCETHINELQSPALLINLDTVEQNCRNMEAIAAKHNVNLRAHVKTHKTLEIAEMQLRDQTEKRIEVSTIPEAFYFADKGFDDILYGLIMSQSKFNQIEQIAALQSPNTISVMTDSFHLTSQMIQYAKYNSKTNNFKFNVFIKVDSGTQRTGFDITNTRTQTQKNELLETVKLIKNNSKYCNLIGLYQYSNNCYTIGHEQMQKVFENERKILMNTIAEITNECDIEIPIISSGSTPACMAVDNFEGINEIHPGNYVFFDRMQYEFGIVDDLESIPISVMSRIIGIYPHRNEIVIDCGNVGISLDKNHESEPDIGYGSIKNYPNLKLYKLSQEVGKITTIDGRDINFNDDGLQYGGILQLIPHHSCLMACQHPFYYIVNDNDTVIDVYHKVSGW